MEHSIFKPKSEEELGDAYREMKQKTNEFMTKIFNDLHQDPDDSNMYKNSEGVWMFYYSFKYDCIYVSFFNIWLYFYANIIKSYIIVKILIEEWLKENTDWPKYEIGGYDSM